jgi:hypothetical protein
MGQSIMVPGAGDRWEKYKAFKFHAEAPAKVEAGRLGRAYLAALRRILATVHDEEMGRIAQVADQALAARRAGHRAHVFAHGHAIRYHVEVPHDTGLFHQVSRGLFALKADHGIQPGDLVFCVGYDRIFQGSYFADAMERMLAAGASLAWSMTGYNKDPASGPIAVPAGETIVGQHWDLGDAVVQVPGYDIEILPPSGVVAEAIFRMTEAELLGK